MAAPGTGLDKPTMISELIKLSQAIEAASKGDPNPDKIKKMHAEGLAEIIEAYVKSGKVVIDPGIDLTVTDGSGSTTTEGNGKVT